MVDDSDGDQEDDGETNKAIIKEEEDESGDVVNERPASDLNGSVDDNLNSSIQNENDDEQTDTPKAASKAKSKKANKKATEKPASMTNNKPVVLLKCTICSAEFDTRNKLFQHISAEGHTANKIEVSAATAAAALDAGVTVDGQPLSHNAIKKNKRLAKLANGKK